MPETIKILVGEAASIPLEMLDRLGRVLPEGPFGSSAILSSSDPLVADGMLNSPQAATIIGKTLGSTIVTYTDGTITGSVAVEVIAPTPFSARFAVELAAFTSAA